ncbi:uncharacterized protein EV422DRAFT_7012 [Fimicolochytrium jonesii]|uniref:uncharacterized protein n=1 Tax=Fimicolochytrium jonesii TaxID=1396493 RepID=UPI0022FDC91D|nr:uncharacterized protein EV422DRAFT_7012 [Fimicolochytrium jonesii]KAI8826696.1 hypothetical protein EV422DRAFT_7012 [Fimicolochytrium jonesii]
MANFRTIVRPFRVLGAFIVLSLLWASLISAHGTAVSADRVSECPIAEKCPYYERIKVQRQARQSASGDDAEAHHGCPLKSGGCPYYEQHKNDHNAEDALVEPGDACPLASKCKWYQDIKDGKANSVDFNKSDCPLKDKCPYYAEIKQARPNTDRVDAAGKKASDCPVLHACPHFSKEDIKSQPHPHGHAHEHGHQAAKCPHLQKVKQQEEAEKAAAAAGGRDEL